MDRRDVIRAVFELSPPGSEEALAIEESLGLPVGPAFVRGQVVGPGVLEFPAHNWGRNVPMLLSALVAGEGVETRAFTRCRLVGLSLPEGWLPGPAFAPAPTGVGCIIKPSLGLSPREAAAVAAAIAAGGASLVKDDELLGDPEWCPLFDRVREVAAALAGSSCVYTPNITGPTAGLLDRARRVVELGATGVMVNAFAQGLDSVLALRELDLGVPVLAHRVGSGPMTRSRDFGVSSAVLADLTRQCGADYVLVGSYGGKLFDSDDEIDAQLAAVRRAPAATAVLGGGVGPSNAREQAERAGGASGLLLLLGSAAYAGGDVEGAVRSTVEALRSS